MAARTFHIVEESGSAVCHAEDRSDLYATSISLPTLFATRLRMELLLDERTVDLSAAVAIVLQDPGAVLAIFRKAFEEGAMHLQRIEDCLAFLPSESWMDAICDQALERVLPSGIWLDRALALCEHSRLIAQLSWFAAQSFEGICPEQAYLAGLLHEAPQIAELCRAAHMREFSVVEESGSRLISNPVSYPFFESCHLPAFLEPLFRGRATHPLCEVVALAHRWTNMRGESQVELQA